MYVLQPGSQVWLPEIGLGIGRCRGVYQGVPREWLYWYDELGQRLLTPEELIQQEKQRLLEEQQRRLQEQQLRQEAEQRSLQEQQRRQEAEQRSLQEQQLRQEAERKAQILAERLRELGIDPENLQSN
jgi:hypothetical protein